MKICEKCNEEKNIEDFHKNRNVCKNCVKLYKKEYYKKNKNYVLNKVKKYREDNKEIINKKNKIYYKNNKEKAKLTRKKYYDKNKSKLEKYYKWFRDNHKLEKKEYDKLYREKNKEFFLFKKAQERAKKRNENFLLKIKDIIIPEICPLLNIKMQINENNVKYNSFSLDKINPKGIYEKNNIWIICYKANRSKNNSTIEEYKKIVNNLEAIINKNIIIGGGLPNKKIIFNSFKGAKHRSNENKLNFNLTIDYLKSIYPKNNICPLLEIEINSYNKNAKWNSASLDRIIPELGYVKGNVVFVSRRANIIKNNLTLEEMKLLLKNWKQELINRNII